MAAASNATKATLDFVVCGLALETWQDIGNAHGCLYKRNDGFMAAKYFFLGELKKLVTHEEVVCTGRGSVEEIPTDLRANSIIICMPSRYPSSLLCIFFLRLSLQMKLICSSRTEGLQIT